MTSYSSSKGVLTFFSRKFGRDVVGVILAFLQPVEFYGSAACGGHGNGAGRTSLTTSALTNYERQMYQQIYWRRLNRQPTAHDLVVTDSAILCDFIGSRQCLHYLEGCILCGCFRVVYRIFESSPNVHPRPDHLLLAIRSGCLIMVQYFVEYHSIEGVPCFEMVMNAINTRSVPLLVYFLDRLGCALKIEHFENALLNLRREEQLALTAITGWPSHPVPPPSVEIVRYIVNSTHPDFLQMLLQHATEVPVKSFDLHTYIICRMLLSSKRLP